MIRFHGVTVTYPEATAPVLRDVDLEVPEGELCLVVGRTGSGKSTLLRCVNGLVPHFTGGRLSGHVVVGGRDTRTHRPRDLADVVGFVGQDPPAGFVTDTVEDELAYAMESLGVAPATMRRRVEETLDLLGLAEVRERPLLTLSAGQQQRVAIGSVLTAAPRILVLDEPTSALDPGAAEEVLAALTRLVHDLGVTVVLAEHRLERVVQYADRVVHVVAGGAVESGDPGELMQRTPVAPPVVELGRLAGWSPLPLSVRDARRAAAPLRDRLAGLQPPSRPAATGTGVVSLRRVSASYDGVRALRGVDLDVARGEIVAVMGRNGAGKSTLLGVVAGLRAVTSGTVDVAGDATHGRPPRDVVRRVGLVPSEPVDILWAQSVEAECADADRDAAVPAGTTVTLLDALAPDVDGATHPRDLSEGQRVALALAVVLASAPAVVALDEPTRGLDYPAKQRLVEILRDLAAGGHAVLLATHDVELAAELADRIVVLADGEVVADGGAREVAVSSPLFAPQVAKVLAPQPWLTVRDVATALAG
ncbi:MAG TPA: ATP-binding cassette domain-containing protein [Mycobacteriales bacterium]|nr:ATP-binding cassette domain-containing protein [Mycobacteriales bacterium]